MESLRENKPLLWSIALSGLAIVGLLSGSSPEFNEQFALVDIPTEVSIYYTDVGPKSDHSFFVPEKCTAH
jgi:cation-transporting ATPase 13A1